ncbi:MAG: hypothetical protein MHM6MM_001785, partial [Cercozoa sp. M6MM]
DCNRRDWLCRGVAESLQRQHAVLTVRHVEALGVSVTPVDTVARVLRACVTTDPVTEVTTDPVTDIDGVHVPDHCVLQLPLTSLSLGRVFRLARALTVPPCVRADTPFADEFAYHAKRGNWAAYTDTSVPNVRVTETLGYTDQQIQRFLQRLLSE